MKPAAPAGPSFAPWNDDRVFVIAEAGSNWRMGSVGRDRRMAQTLIEAAVEAGADAVKFQLFRAETVYVQTAGHSDYLASGGHPQPIQEIFEDLAMPSEMVAELSDYCVSRGIQFMCTPFSPADFAVVDPHVRVHKIASYELRHVRLLELAAQSGKPLVLSTGACTEEDVAWAVETFRHRGGGPLCLMQCTARYPAPPDSLNLLVIPRLAQRFGVVMGLSDHSRDPVHAPIAAVALGARVIEKHFTLDNRLPGPDHPFAVTPVELAALVRAVREARVMLGSGRKEILPVEHELAGFARRGVQAMRAIRKGELLSEGRNIDILRPGRQALGLHPRQLPEIEGRRALRDIPCGDGIIAGDFE